MPFGEAVTILCQKAGLKELHPSRFKLEEVKQMMERVGCVEDPDLGRTYPKQWRATVEIFAKNGQRHFTKVEYCKGYSWLFIL
jgi:2-methylcitrate dehydratase PrpD